MQAAISKTNIKSFQKTFKSNSTLRMSRNALTRSSVLDVAMNWDAFSQIDHTYSHKIINEMKKEWGIGQVQSSIHEKITINFEHAGKQVINIKEVSLTIVKLK